MGQVVWQGLVDESGGGSVMDDTGAGKASTAAALLTTRRLLIVSATLRPLCAFSSSPSEAAITSFLWLGPALLFCNSVHQVRHPDPPAVFCAADRHLQACIAPSVTGVCWL